jgi:hypothetical protein
MWKNATVRLNEEKSVISSGYTDGSGAPGKCSLPTKYVNPELWRLTELTCHFLDSYEGYLLIQCLDSIDGSLGDDDLKKVQSLSVAAASAATERLHKVFNVVKNPLDKCELRSNLIFTLINLLKVDVAEYIGDGIVNGFAVGLTSDIPTSSGLMPEAKITDDANSTELCNRGNSQNNP